MLLLLGLLMLPCCRCQLAVNNAASAASFRSQLFPVPSNYSNGWALRC